MQQQQRAVLWRLSVDVPVVRIPEHLELSPARVLWRCRVDEHHPDADHAAGEPSRSAEDRDRVGVGEGQVGKVQTAGIEKGAANRAEGSHAMGESMSTRGRGTDACARDHLVCQPADAAGADAGAGAVRGSLRFSHVSTSRDEDNPSNNLMEGDVLVEGHILQHGAQGPRQEALVGRGPVVQQAK